MANRFTRRLSAIDPIRCARSRRTILGISAITLSVLLVSVGPAHGAMPGADDFLWGMRWETALLTLLTAMIGYGLVLNRRLNSQNQRAIAAEQVFREIAEASTDWVWSADRNGRYQDLSRGYQQFSGHDPNDIAGQELCHCPAIEISEVHQRRLRTAVSTRKPIRDVLATVKLKPEGQRHVKITGWPHFDKDGEFTGYRGVAVDTSALVAARNQVKFLNAHDNLTGLPNRSALTHRLGAILKNEAEDEHRAALIAVDIERFRSINESYGASTGDRLIQQFAERLKKAFDKDDLISRYANNEFVVLRQRVSALDPLPVTITRLRKLMENPFELDDEQVRISARVGVYELDGSETDEELCIKRAEIALAHSKRNDQYVTIYAAGMDQYAETMRRIEDDLRAAIREDALNMVYQPQMCLRTGRIISAEALLRWIHPTLGEISPAQFIPVAERAGMITELSLWALERAGRDVKGAPGLRVAVNISALDFKQTDLVFAMEGIIDELEIDPKQIELEVTESALIADSKGALDILNRLKAAGFRIALDDFGTGYAGLGYLQMFPFDKIKIDQSFIRRLEEAEHARAIVRSVITLAHDLGLTVVAEGVERMAQIEQLRSADCDVVQGYFLGKHVSGGALGNLQGAKIEGQSLPAERLPI